MSNAIGLNKLDFSGITPDQVQHARNFAKLAHNTLITSTSLLATGANDIMPVRPSITHTLNAGNLLAANPSGLHVAFFFSLFDWLKETIGTLFDDIGVDLAVGTIDGPEGTPTHGGIGLELNFPFTDDPKPSTPPSLDAPIELPNPYHYSKPDREPRLKLKFMFIYNLDSVLDGFVPPSGLPDLSDFSFPEFERGESGFGFGIELKF